MRRTWLRCLLLVLLCAHAFSQIDQPPGSDQSEKAPKRDPRMEGSRLTAYPCKACSQYGIFSCQVPLCHTYVCVCAHSRRPASRNTLAAVVQYTHFHTLVVCWHCAPICGFLHSVSIQRNILRCVVALSCASALLIDKNAAE